VQRRDRMADKTVQVIFEQRLTLLTILAMPLILWIIINSFNLEPIHLGAITIPRLPSPPRHETDIAIFQTNILNALSTNVSARQKCSSSKTMVSLSTQRISDIFIPSPFRSSYWERIFS
jgi:hypothetical protein